MQFSQDVLNLNPGLSAKLAKTARLKPDRSDGFRSDLERDYSQELTARGWIWRYEPITITLPGGVKYTPDFMAWWSGDIYLIECKGSKAMKNARDSRTRFKVAAGMLPCFKWLWVERVNRSWYEVTHNP